MTEYTTRSGHVLREGDLIFQFGQDTSSSFLFSDGPYVIRINRIDGEFAEIEQVFDLEMRPVSGGYKLPRYHLKYASPFTRETLAVRIRNIETLFERILSSHRIALSNLPI
jgi:hypothetical protein